MVIVDRFTKMAHFIGLPENTMVKTVAQTFLHEIWRQHGLPVEIILDMDAKFEGEFCEDLCKLLASSEKCQRHTTFKLMDKWNEPTKCWKVTCEALSTMIRMTGISYCH